MSTDFEATPGASPAVEHAPWLPSVNTHRTFSPEKWAVIGYSHYLSGNEQDGENFTAKLLESIATGAWDHIPFFNKIPKYFHVENPAEFWSQVIFLTSCLPVSVQAQRNTSAVIQNSTNARA
jgi:hypothetical protein